MYISPGMNVYGISIQYTRKILTDLSWQRGAVIDYSDKMPNCNWPLFTPMHCVRFYKALAYDNKLPRCKMMMSVVLLLSQLCYVRTLAELSHVSLGFDASFLPSILLDLNQGTAEAMKDTLSLLLACPFFFFFFSSSSCRVESTF